MDSTHSIIIRQMSVLGRVSYQCTQCQSGRAFGTICDDGVVICDCGTGERYENALVWSQSLPRCLDCVGCNACPGCQLGIGVCWQQQD